jgi:DNA-directed RNA polymerase subunit RPC12/RpoP
MGSLFNIFCQDCGYALKLMWGVGMGYPRPEDLPAMLPRRQREKVRELIERADCTAVHFGWELMICPRCGLPASRLNYRIEFQNGETQQTAPRCSSCRAGLVKTDQLPEIKACPRCGSGRLMQGMGEWD